MKDTDIVLRDARHQFGVLDLMIRKVRGFRANYIEDTKNEIKELMKHFEHAEDGWIVPGGGGLLYSVALREEDDEPFIRGGLAEIITDEMIEETKVADGEESEFSRFIEGLHLNCSRSLESLYSVFQGQMKSASKKLYSKLIEEKFGDDYNGIYLDSAAAPPDFDDRLYSGNWDYVVPQAGRRNPSWVEGKTESFRRIKNKWAVDSRLLNLWKRELERKNRSTRFINWDIGNGEMPREVQKGRYNVVYLDRHCDSEPISKAYGLVQNGCWIICSGEAAKRLKEEKKDLRWLVEKDFVYNAIEKIA